MNIEHIALWAKDLEAMKDFYVRYFGGWAGDQYVNPKHGFASYFVTFDTGARLEIMHMPSVPDNANDVERQALGWIHIAFSVGSKEKVDMLTELYVRMAIASLVSHALQGMVTTKALCLIQKGTELRSAFSQKPI